MFQSTHPHGVRLGVESLSPVSALFQSTHPHGVRPQQFTGLTGNECFNPRTHTGCDKEVARDVPGGEGVSIHAPTRGATIAVRPRLHSDVVSIHAPTRGATLARQEDGGVPGVSIHAPTRGATLTEAQRKWADEFQSTHPHGVRRRCSWNCFLWTMFQSTHPHGVRH